MKNMIYILDVLKHGLNIYLIDEAEIIHEGSAGINKEQAMKYAIIEIGIIVGQNFIILKKIIVIFME